MNIELTILTALDLHAPVPMRQEVILSDVRSLTAERPTSTEVQRALDKLEGKNQVIGISNEDKGTMWKITTEGTMRLAEYNS